MSDPGYYERLVRQGVEDRLLDAPNGFGWVGVRHDVRGKTRIAALAKLIFKLTEGACADKIDCITDRDGDPMWRVRA